MDDLWGDEPDWALDDDDDDEDGGRSNYGGGGGGGDDEEEDDEEAVLAGAHHVIFLLDCHPDMFVPCITDPDWPDDVISPMDAAVKACERYLAAKLRNVAAEKTGKRDGCGILLYGTKHRANTNNTASLAPRRQDDGDNDNDSDEETDEEDSDFEGPATRGSTTHVLLPLEPPGIPQYKSVRECLDDPVLGREVDLEAEYGHGDNANPDQDNNYSFQQHPLQTALLQVNQMFRKAKCVKKKATATAATTTMTTATVYNDDVKELWIFTNQDNPTASKEQVERLLLRTAKDVKENDIEIVLWSLPNNKKKDQTFDRKIFFDKIINKGTSSNKSIITTTSDESNQYVLCLDDLLEILDRQRKKMRRILFAPLFLPTADIEASPGIMLDFYRNVRIHTKPYPRTIHQQKKKETVRVRDIVNKDTGELVFSTRTGPDASSGKNRLRFYAKLGADRVPLTQQEVKEIKRKSNILQKSNGLILWGFKKKAHPFHYTIEPSYFVFPNDEHVKGSTKAFANLHAAMLRKGVIGYGELLTRISAIPRLVEIHAVAEVREQIEVEDSDEIEERQFSPPGMTLFVLPFADEVRSIPADRAREIAETKDDAPPIASDEAVAAAMELIQGLKLEDVELGERFVNAPLTEFWNYVESVALDLPIDESASKHQYDTQINDSEVLERVGKQIENFKSTLPEDEVAESGSRKRKPASEKSDVESLYRSSKLEKATIAQLSAFLNGVGIQVPGKPKKADYIRRIDQYFREMAGEVVAVKMEVEENESDDIVEQNFRADRLEKCTVAQLKQYLEQAGEPVAARCKKAELLEQVSQFLLTKREGNETVVKMEEESEML